MTTRGRPRWPAALHLVRHAESVGNVAREQAEASGSPIVDIADRDMDVALSPRGREQAAALGDWLRGLGRRRPSVVLTSPYERAAGTARIAVETGGMATGIILDERLRERDLGTLDRLTRTGIEQRHPDQAAARAHLGKFYYRPPGGESWSDVALRVRSIVDSISREHGGERVLIVTHEVVVYVFRYVLERMTEPEILALSRAHELANASVTSFAVQRGRHADGMVLEAFNAVRPLAESGAPITAESDVPVAPR